MHECYAMQVLETKRKKKKKKEKEKTTTTTKNNGYKGQSNKAQGPCQKDSI